MGGRLLAAGGGGPPPAGAPNTLPPTPQIAARRHGHKAALGAEEGDFYGHLFSICFCVLLCVLSFFFYPLRLRLPALKLRPLLLHLPSLQPASNAHSATPPCTHTRTHSHASTCTALCDLFNKQVKHKLKMTVTSFDCDISTVDVGVCVWVSARACVTEGDGGCCC